MSGHCNGVRLADASEIFGLPKIFCLHCTGETECAEVHSSGQRFGMSVEDPYGLRSVSQRTRPYLDRPLSAHAVSLLPCRILIDVNHTAIRQKRNRLGSHRRKIVSSQQRRSQNCPQTHVSPILIQRHSTVADLQHVGIIPMSRAGKASQSSLAETNLNHLVVRVSDISRGAPKVAANSRAPLPHRIVSVLAETVHNWAAGAAQRVSHL